MPTLDQQPAGSNCERTAITSTITRAFFASVLISGNHVLAEDAVTNAIELLQTDES